MDNTTTQLQISKEYRIGQENDEGIAATEGDLLECECCGRNIARISLLTNGARVGSECATYLTRPDLRKDEETIRLYFGRRSKKADAYLLAGNYR